MPDQQSEKIALRGQGLPRLFYATALAILLGYILWVGKSIIIPLVFALFFSFIIITVKNTIEKTPVLGAMLPEWLSFVLAFALMAFTLVILGQIIIANAEAMLEVFPQYRARFLEISGVVLNYLSQISFLADYFPEAANTTVTDVPEPSPATNSTPPETAVTIETSSTDEVEQATEGLGGETTPEFQVPDMALFAQWQSQAIGLATSFFNEIGSTVRALGTNLVTILLYTSFMLVERGRFLRKLNIIAGNSHDQLDVDQILQDIGTLVREYISIKATTSLLVATMSFIIMQIIGVDFAGFWALLIFSFGFIPIIGAVIAIMLPSLLALVQPDGGFGLFLTTLISLTVAEQFVSQAIEPRLLGRSLNLSPLVILLSLTFWGTLWGFGGMLLCIPITVGIMIVLSQFEASRGVAVMLSGTGEIKPIQRKMATAQPPDTQHDNQQEAD